MYYKIIKKFGSDSGKKWQDYIQWSGFAHLDRFDSVDSVLRPDLFSPVTNEDWDNCVNEDFKLNLITNYEYATKVLSKFKDAVIVGVELNVTQAYLPKINLLGYDIIDGACSISLITNWGCKEYPFDRNIIKNNGLIIDIDDAIKARDMLRTFPHGDSHSAGCNVWAIYNVRQAL